MDSSALSALSTFFPGSGPGAAVAVIGAKGSVATACTGFADIRARLPIRPDTRFELASASKVFTATAIMHLVAQGEIELAAPVATVLPTWFASNPGRPITIRDLLQHTSGLPDYLAEGRYTPDAERTHEYVAQQLPAWSAVARPGETFAYANTNYVALAAIVSGVAGKPFAAFMQDTFWGPLGMRQTEVCPQGAKVACGYAATASGLPLFAPAEELPIDTVGDGGVVSCLDDLVRWQQAFWEDDVLPAEMRALMTTAGRDDGGQPFAYGLGMQVEQNGASGERWYGHTGSWTHSTTLLGRWEPTKVSVVVLSNEVMAPVERIAQWAAATAQS